MNIALKQLLSNTKLNVAKVTDVAKQETINATKPLTAKAEAKESTKFGTVFDKVIASQKQPTANNSVNTTDAETVNLEETQAMLQTTSVEQLFNLLGIQYDGGLLE